MCRQRDELIASRIEKRVGVDEECAGSQLRESRERRVDFLCGAAASPQDMQLQSERARRFLHLARPRLSKRVDGINDHSDHACLWYQLVQKLQPLRHQLRRDKGDARGITT